MPIFEIAGKRVLFLHIPKTGGWALSEHLSSAYPTTLIRIGSEKDLADSALKTNPQHFTVHDTNALFGRSHFEITFAIVRNPYDRILSEYRWRRTFMKWKKRPFEDWIHEHLRTFNTNPFHLDNHLRPQSDFVDKSVRVFRYEDGLQEPIRWINASLGCNIPLVVARQNAGEQASVEIPKAVQRELADLYGCDFEQFGYDPHGLPD